MSFVRKEESLEDESRWLREFRHVRSETAMQEMERAYTLGDVLGQGSFGVVYLAKSNANDGNEFACKTVKKKIGSTATYEQQEREVRILSSLQHQNILQLFAVYEDSKSISMIVELCHGGHIANVVNQMGFCSLTTIRKIISQLVDAVSKYYFRIHSSNTLSSIFTQKQNYSQRH